MGHGRRAAAYAARTQGQQILVGSAARNSNGEQQFSGMGMGDLALKLELTVSAISGTGATLAVVVEGSDDGVTWTNKASFTSRTTEGSEVVTVPTPIKDRMKVRWTLTGTSPVATFQVVNRLDLRAY